MKNTLLSCLTRGDSSAGMGEGCNDGSGVPPDVLSISGQYWDRIIWAVGAWAYYCQTGDRDFLPLAAEAIRNSLAYLEDTEFDPEWGLFRGGACIHDGVGAYGDIYADQEGCAIFDWVAAHPDKRHPRGAGLPLFALSTNCLYAEAYRLLGLMTGTEPAREHQRLVEAIRTHFWMPDRGHYRFYLDPWGGCGGRQECLGNVFALLFGIATPEQIPQVIANQPRHPFGPPSVWPEWERYTKDDIDPYGCPPNRPDIAAENHTLRSDPRSQTNFAGHGGAVWPLIHGLWGETMARMGHQDLFEQDLRLMAGYFCRAVQSPECVHPDCGLPYGGLQETTHGQPIVRWPSCYRQTWSATSYIRMILGGLLGIESHPDHLRIRPRLAAGIDRVELSGLPWRRAILDITIQGSRPGRITLDGQPLESDTLPGDLEGQHSVVIQ